jgi:hypothetical protein
MLEAGFRSDWRRGSTICSRGLGFLDEPEDLRAFEYRLLVTSLPHEALSIACHYRDRGNCGKNFQPLPGLATHFRKARAAGTMRTRQIRRKTRHPTTGTPRFY